MEGSLGNQIRTEIIRFGILKCLYFRGFVELVLVAFLRLLVLASVYEDELRNVLFSLKRDRLAFED